MDFFDVNEVILNWMPPAAKDWPAPSMSVLKTHLNNNNKNARVIYWNVILDEILKEYLFLNEEPSDELGFLSLFYSYIAKDKGDEVNLLKQEMMLRSIKPQYRNNNSNYFKFHIENSLLKLEKRIKDTLREIDLSKCLIFGMSMNLYQWIPSIVIAKILKEKYPNIKTCIGGIGTKEAATTYLKNFKYFDYAIWGEGEYPLLQLVNALENEETLEQVPNLIYRENFNLARTKNRKKEYFDLNNKMPIDYSDYFSQVNIDQDRIGIPIEGSRGCHWMKCKFCFLNEGYRYRVKSPETIVREIKHYINHYKILKFQFLDNDLIGKNLIEFDKFLDLLIDLKKEFPKFEIFLAEIVTKGLDAHIIKKMSLAGFHSVQIGYESPSDSLLGKISKKNTFASNLLFIKWANIYNIRINGANVLRGLLEETDNDIFESIDNLHFLRFVLDKGYFQHSISQLAIGKSSKYYKDICNTNEYHKYTDVITELMSEDFLSKEDRDTIFYSVRHKQSLYWNFFEKTEKYYLDNKFEYSLIPTNNKILYNEYYNKEEIKTLEFDVESSHWKILKSCNKNVISISELEYILNLDLNEISTDINDLIEEGLLYQSSNKKEVISIINTDTIVN